MREVGRLRKNSLAGFVDAGNAKKLNFAKSGGSDRAMKFVSFYEMASDALPKIKAHYPAHRARLDEFHARGVILGAGPLGNPPEGALAVFTTREAAEEFIQGDPFVVNGLCK